MSKASVGNAHPTYMQSGDAGARSPGALTFDLLDLLDPKTASNAKGAGAKGGKGREEAREIDRE